MNGEGSLRTFKVHEIIEPGAVTDAAGRAVTLGTPEKGLVRVNYKKSGDIGSWQGFYPFVLGLEFKE